MIMSVYECEDTLEGILCGVYHAWKGSSDHRKTKLKLKKEEETRELFTDYIQVETENLITERIIQAIRLKISEEAYEIIYKASLSYHMNKADKIYRFLIHGFRYGGKVVNMLQIQEVFEVFQLCRNIEREVHSLTGFVRFTQVKRNILTSCIGPCNQVLPLLAPHFADRFPSENWIIYDEIRKIAAIHPADRLWFLMEINLETWDLLIKRNRDSMEYEDLWGIFRENISIEERKNLTCQNSHMPIRFRPYMTEFCKK